MDIINGTVTTGGTAEDALDEGHNHLKIVLRAGDSDIWFNLGADAATNDGELVPAGASATINFSSGERLSVNSPDSGAAYSIRPSI